MWLMASSLSCGTRLVVCPRLQQFQLVHNFLEGSTGLSKLCSHASMRCSRIPLTQLFCTWLLQHGQ